MDAGITTPNATTNEVYVPYFSKANSVLIPTTSQALAFTRTPQQILAIAYGGNASQPGAPSHALCMLCQYTARSVFALPGAWATSFNHDDAAMLAGGGHSGGELAACM